MDQKALAVAALAALLTYRYDGPVSYDNRIAEARELLRRAEAAVEREKQNEAH